MEGEEEEMEEEGAEVPALAASCLQHWGSAFWAVPAFRQHRRSGAPSRPSPRSEILPRTVLFRDGDAGDPPRTQQTNSGQAQRDS